MIGKEVIGKTIGEVIVSADCKVKLGAEDGSAFIFCGELKALDIENLNNEIYTSLEQRLDIAKQRLKLRKDRPPTINDYMNAEFEKSGGYSCGDYDGYTTFVKRYFSSLKGISTSIMNLDDAVNTYVHLKDRVITDVYKSIMDQDVTIIKYTGDEHGRYWDADECANDIEEK